jgi:hypothetical protein
LTYFPAASASLRQVDQPRLVLAQGHMLDRIQVGATRGRLAHDHVRHGCPREVVRTSEKKDGRDREVAEMHFGVVDGVDAADHEDTERLASAAQE